MPLVLNDSDSKKSKEYLEQVNIFDVFTNENIDTQLSKYPTAKHKKIVGPLAKNVFIVITLDELVIFDEDVISKDILSST